MRWVTVLLLVVLVWFRQRLWLDKGGWQDVWRLQENAVIQNANVEKLTQRNKEIEADIQDFREGKDAISEVARDEMGYIGQGEVFYRIKE